MAISEIIRQIIDEWMNTEEAQRLTTVDNWVQPLAEYIAYRLEAGGYVQT